jgi:hypothetical protein
VTLNDYYNELGLPSNADINELKHAYRSKAKKLHPDLNVSSDAENDFIRVHKAYETILNHMQGKARAKVYDDVLYEFRKEYRKQQVYNFARKQYEERNKEWEAYHNSPYAWIFKVLYYGLFYLYIFCAMVFSFVPIWAGLAGGLFYLAISLPLYVLAYFTVKMAMQWKKEIEPLFN